jgi:uncharacterized protein (TIGR02246 family)
MKMMPLVLAGLTASVPASALTEAEARQAAQRLTETEIKAEQEKDIGAVIALFTEDAVQVTPEGLNSGHAAIEQFYTAGLKDYTPDFGKIERVTPLGDGVILAAGSWSGTYHSPDGPVRLSGYWSWTTVKTGSIWKISQETFNVTPAPPEARK